VQHKTADLGMRLHDLERRVAAALRDVPGATALLCFGSRVAGGDGYADLDMLLVTADLPAARAVWPAVLARIAQVRFTLRLDDHPDGTSYAVAFRGESPYHKLDISLHDAAAELRVPGALRWLWRQPPAAGGRSETPLNAFAPPHGSSGHLLLEELVSLVRYAKARRRGQHLTAWRFARGALETLLRLRAAPETDPVPPQLSTWDFVTLDERLAEPERLGLVATLDWSTPTRMDQARVSLADAVIAAVRARALAQNDALPPELEQETLAFVRSELAEADGP
jgi:hypothetical protein